MTRPDLLRVSFVVALPFDVGFAQDSTSTLLDVDEPVPGWDDSELLIKPGGPSFAELFPDQSAGPRLATSMWFRRVRVRGERPLEATEKAFGSLLYPSRRLPARLLTRLRDWRRERGAPGTVRGVHTRAVVQLTRIVLAPVDASAADDGWLSDQFDEALSKLNEVLIATAAVSGDPAIGPVSTDELPPFVPALLGPLDSIAPDVSLLWLNFGPQGEADLLSPGQMQHIFGLAGRQHGPGHPYFAMGESMAEARRAFTRGRAAHGVLELGTAFELMVAATVREVGRIRGEDDARIAGILESGLTNVVRDHLPAFLGVPVDIDDPQTPFGGWWQRGYLLRNRVVHEGHRPGADEVADARAAADDVIVAVSSALLARRETEAIGRLLAAPQQPD